MTEIDLIVKYLEKTAGKVIDVSYYSETVTFTAAVEYYLGAYQGYSPQGVYFFGHINVTTLISGVVVLTDMNTIFTEFNTDLKGRMMGVGFSTYIGVNNGLSLTGDGQYVGSKRMYGVGLNKINITVYDLGAATFVSLYTFNGYLFVIR